MNEFVDALGIVFLCGTLGTPFIAYRLLEKYNWSGVAKVSIGALIAAFLSLIFVVIGFALIFRNGGFC